MLPLSPVKHWIQEINVPADTIKWRRKHVIDEKHPSEERFDLIIHPEILYSKYELFKKLHQSNRRLRIKFPRFDLPAFKKFLDDNPSRRTNNDQKFYEFLYL